jgi:hypothetical protein
MVKTFIINIYYGTDQNLSLNFMNDSSNWIMHYNKQTITNHIFTQEVFENIKVEKDITYDLILTLIDKFNKDNLNISTEIGYTDSNYYPSVGYFLIDFNEDNFHKVFDNLQEYGDIENQWFLYDNDKFKKLYPYLL